MTSNRRHAHPDEPPRPHAPRPAGTVVRGSPGTLDGPHLHLPAALCQDPRRALAREWLITNGIGGFAAGTIGDALTRRYHGLLIAALEPPASRRLLVAKLDTTITSGGLSYPLYTNIWPGGIESPNGCLWLQRFDLAWGLPSWTYACGPAQVVRRVWMERGYNVTFVRYELSPDSPPAELTTRVLVNDRHYHFLRRGDQAIFQVRAAGAEIEVRPPAGRAPYFLRAGGAGEPNPHWTLGYDWCWNFELLEETARGFDHREDHLCVATARAELRPGDTLTFTLAATDGRDITPVGALERAATSARQLLDRRRTVLPASHTDPPAVQQLVLAADQFLVRRPAPSTGTEAVDGHTVIAGYPWFTDWGRDTMVALPGLTLATGRPELAREVLRTWARYVDQGMVPNRFADDATAPEYHTADATLWYLWAIDRYVRATGDVRTLAELFPVMADIVAWHRRGTRHHIHVGDDGLVYAGESDVNLTWMDAKVGGRVITPRTGKPVELSALWYDALCNMARLADLLDLPSDEYARLALRTRGSFARFWHHGRACCYDVLDGPHGPDGALRPNQILAVALTHSPLSAHHQREVVAACEEYLLTWFGLRTLGHREAGYRGRYDGGPAERDEAYHQGTAWGWLLGLFVLAHYRVHRDAHRCQELLAPLLSQVWTAGVGSLSEIYDGNEPFRPNGCTAQAWTVAMALWAWDATQWVPERGAVAG